MPAGLGVQIGVGLNQLVVAPSVTEEYLNNGARGLLGTYNDNLEDEFTPASGKVLNSSIVSDLGILHRDFAETCKFI